MEQSLFAPQPGRQTPLVAIQDAHEKAREFVHAAKAESTKRTYRIAWRDFSNWCVRLV